MPLHFFIFFLGLIFGSFIAALTYRFPLGISIAKGRSFCPNCKKQINWYDNVPVFSYLFLMGKCRNCKRKIPWRYPIIELLTAFGFVAIGLNIPYLSLFLIFEIIFIIDLENQYIPDFFVFLGLLLIIFTNNTSIFSNILAGFASASFLLLVYLVTKGRGMGLGDVKFAILGGFVVGLQLFPIWLFIAFLTGAIVGTILMLMGNFGLKSKIAFGPFLAMAVPLTFVFGKYFVNILGI
jgi:leader peptidase (prepilin peptidase) / N-methyltransferase